MSFKDRTILQLAEMICVAANENRPLYFKYRSSSHITRFFQDCDLDYTHQGETRIPWVADCLREILNGVPAGPNLPPEPFFRVIRVLMDQEDAAADDPGRMKALNALNIALGREGYEAFYAEDKQCYLRHVGTKVVGMPSANPHRPFSAIEIERRNKLITYLDQASEDSLINEILLPLFRQLGFHRVTAAGHKDKALEYGKDIWMRFTLPTQHVLYFGIQAKRDKLDAAGVTKTSNANVSEIYNQALMMLGHEIFDPEIGKKVLVDHAFIVSGGEITKAARNWLGGMLDATKRSQIMFMDRDDILNLFVVTNLPLPASAIESSSIDTLLDEIPF